MAVSYKPSGRYDPAGIWVIPIVMALVVALGGALHNWFTFGPIVRYITHLASHMTLGVICMLAAGGLTWIFKMRNPGKAIIAAMSGAAVGWLCAWMILKYMAAPDETFFSFISDRLHKGFTYYPRKPSHGPYRVYGLELLLGWGLETLVVIGFAALGANMQASRPFSERKGVWLSLRVMNPPLKVYPPADYEVVIKGLSKGQMTYLKYLSLDEPPKISLFRRVPSVTIMIMVDNQISGAFLSLIFDDGKKKSFSLINNAYIDDKAVKTILNHFKWTGRRKLR